MEGVNDFVERGAAGTGSGSGLMLDEEAKAKWIWERCAPGLEWRTGARVPYLEVSLLWRLPDATRPSCGERNAHFFASRLNASTGSRIRAVRRALGASDAHDDFFDEPDFGL